MAPGQIRSWKAATKPEMGERVLSDLLQIQPGKVMKGDTSGQRLRTLPQQVRCSTAKNQESRRLLRAIGEYSQDREEIRSILNLVDYDETTQRFEGEHGFIQSRKILRLLQIKKMTLPLARRYEQSCERGFSDLTCAQQRDDWIGPQISLQFLDMRCPGDSFHALNIGRFTCNLQ